VFDSVDHVLHDREESIAYILGIIMKIAKTKTTKYSDTNSEHEHNKKSVLFQTVNKFKKYLQSEIK
jgi:hypothetical protein